MTDVDKLPLLLHIPDCVSQLKEPNQRLCAVKANTICLYCAIGGIRIDNGCNTLLLELLQAKSAEKQVYSREKTEAEMNFEISVLRNQVTLLMICFSRFSCCYQLNLVVA